MDGVTLMMEMNRKAEPSVPLLWREKTLLRVMGDHVYMFQYNHKTSEHYQNLQ